MGTEQSLLPGRAGSWDSLLWFLFFSRRSFPDPSDPRAGMELLSWASPHQPQSHLER